MGLANPRHVRKLDLREACGPARGYQLFGEDQPLRGNGLLFGPSRGFFGRRAKNCSFVTKSALVAESLQSGVGRRCVTSPL